jgi:hypothetical protein
VQGHVTGLEGELGEFPLRIDRPFLLWSYEVSHRRLVLREQPGDEAGVGAVEVEFLNVLGMKVKSQYSQLLISRAPAPGTPAAVDIDAFVSVPDRHRSTFVTLLVSDGADDGFVICGSLRLRES